MTGIDSWSTSAATNATADGGSSNWAEGMAPSVVNNSARQNLADIRSAFNSLIWFQYGTGDQGSGNLAVPAVYASATSFTITGADVTTIYEAGRRVRAVGSSTGTIYGTISSSSYNGGNTTTTVNVGWDSGSLSSETLVVSLSQIPVTGFPSGLVAQPLWVASGGTADAITATYAPAVATLTDGFLLGFRATAANATTTPTFAPNGLTARTITKNGGAALAKGDIAANLGEYFLRYNLANTRWELLNPCAAFAGTFTPAITFGGAAVGITYSQQVGRYQINGNRVSFQLYILLSNKGSSTGTLNVTGLPIATLNVANAFPSYSAVVTGMLSMNGALMSFSLVNSTVVRIQQLGSGTATDLTDANFSNTSEIFVSGSYER